ncbi:uncharacterized protein LOC114271605 [Camellia sinensis]|uniref:uncharacterized protein LOC114271605 n=1 Tax=Camellia sinensis TaxID=4442 RepID=UPI001036E160|nr:uncharacterized protein LOC114271605 [Camellia sinensis]
MIYSLLTTSVVHTIQSHPNPHKQITPAKRPHEAASITFDDSNLASVTLPHIDPLVIELRVNRFTVERVLIDQGSTSEVMYYKTFIKLGFTELDLSPAHYPLFGFNANLEYPLGKITLPVRAGSRSVDVKFLVVKLPSSYIPIMGRTWLHTLQVVPSTYHQLLRFPTERGIEQIRGSQKSAQACYLLAAKTKKELEESSIEVLDRESLDDDGRLTINRQQLISFLLGNLDVFAWSLYEMPGVDPSVSQHRLNVDPKCKPIIQKSRRSAAEHTTAVVEELDQLLDAGVIREVTYPT